MATKPKAIQFTVLNSELNMGRQSVDLTELVSVAIGETTHKCRIKIKSDSYNFQCYAKIDIWKPSELEWKPLDAIHYNEMNTKDGLISTFGNESIFNTRKSFTRKLFDDDVKELQRRALLILT